MPVDDAQPILMELLGPGTRGRGGYVAASFGEEFSSQTDTSPALPPVEVHSRLRPYRSMATAGNQRRSIA